MKDDKEKIKEETRGRKMQSDSVRVVPVLKKTIDISKVGKVILALIASQEEAHHQEAVKSGDQPKHKGPDNRGSHHDEVV